ncbi:hypothetical protein [Brucella sp. SA075A]
MAEPALQAEKLVEKTQKTYRFPPFSGFYLARIPSIWNAHPR